VGWLVALRTLPAPRSARPDRRELCARERAVRDRVRVLSRSERRRLAALAAALSPLRARILELTGAPRCCARCAEPTPWGGASLPGGLCCSGESEAIFTPFELAPLLLSGHPPSACAIADPHAGCLFRSATGCLLPASGRPSICLGHLCRELSAELHPRGVLQELLAVAEELHGQTRAIGEALGLSAGPAGDRRSP